MRSIEFSMAKNSELTFTVDGRHLCSSINPSKEAKSWVVHHEKYWKNCETVIVVGLGCGYHVRALQIAGCPHVIAVEPSKGVISAALRVHPLDLQESNLVHLDSPEGVL